MGTSSPSPNSTSDVLHHDGMLWQPVPGASATAEEFTDARALFMNLHAEARWNPWVLDDHVSELAAAMDVMEQWTRAEPGFRQLTSKQLDARLKAVSRRCRAEHARLDRRRERDRARYDAEREAHRLALLELSARLAVDLAELEGYRSGVRFPAMTAPRREAEMTELSQRIEWCRAETARLRDLVGDPEAVVDERGWLPRDRRELNLGIFSSCRVVDVRRLRAETTELAAKLKSLRDKTERANVRATLREKAQRLETLEAVPPLSADDMCSECVTPVARHGWTWPTTDGPCPAWPREAARRREFREMFDAMVRASQPAPAPPKPEPLAVVPSGLPITEITKRLADLQQRFPDAVVKRGRANRWELWPAES